MADVTGRLGNEDIELNNAATEATLKMLLQATLAAAKGSKDELNKIAAMAAKAGLDGDSINQANQAVQATTPQMNALGKTAFVLGAAFGAAEKDFKTLVKTGQDLAAGTAQASGVLSNMATMLPGPLGKVVQGFSALAAFQEGMLVQYQTLTKAGVNFGGSLTDLRLAASSTYMTMQEFTAVVSANGASFAKMGGSVDAGARAFVGISNTLNKSEMGTGLRALGYTTQEVNQGMIDYISISGGRTQKEMQNTAQLAKESAGYLEQLDGLAKLTGESREALAAKMKDDAAAQAFEGYLLTLDKDGREKAIAARLEAEARGGKGAAQALQAKLMGLPPMTEAAQKFVGTMQGGNKALDGLADNVKDSSKSLDDVKRSGAGLSSGLAQDGRNLKQVASAQIMAGKDVELFGKALGAANAATRNGVTNTEEQIAFEQKIAEETKKQKESEAKAAVESKKALEELGQGILKMVMPFVKMLLPVVNALAPLAPYIMAVVAAFAALKGAMAAKAALGALGGGGGGGPLDALKGGGGGGGGAAGGGGMLSGMGAGLKGAASGLRAFANPMVIAGAAGFGIAIAAIGAGIAGAAWLVGKALPTLAEGFMKFTEIDGAKLGASAFGIAKLGLGLIPFAPMALWGLPVGLALNMMGDGLQKIAAVDPSRLEKVAAGMEKVKAATPTVGESIRAGISGLVSKAIGPSESAGAPAGKEGASSANEIINLIAEVKRLNTTSAETLRYIKETAEYTKRTVDATKNLNRDFFTF
jgi:hypothetical protein